MKGIIIKGVGGQYTVDTGDGFYICNARGLFRKHKTSPIVGDRVEIATETENVGTLMKLLPRSNELQRPKVANVDLVLIVMAATKPSLHFALLDRYLIQAEYEEIDIAICINKADLNSAVPATVSEIYSPIYPIFTTAASQNLGITSLIEHMQNKTTVLAGPSGVGKSSIINLLTDRQLEVGKISDKIGRGKHTTRHTEIIPLDGQSSSYVIDTPGFSSLDLPATTKTEFAVFFREFRPYLGQCRFSDCIHDSETDCAVKMQLGKTISEKRYERYLELLPTV
ncbi:MAG: ribosome small subunit-dependent GTPase A [Turicibacter sp.]|nr:ribosome small subunit-dependent GTPase A [Turicibacter sp.]